MSGRLQLFVCAALILFGFGIVVTDFINPNCPKSYVEEIDAIHREAVEYQLDSERSAKVLAYSLAHPYYKIVNEKKGNNAHQYEPLPTDEIMDYFTIIRWAQNGASKEASAKAQVEADIMLELDMANQRLQEFMKNFYYWRLNVHDDEALQRIQTEFDKCKEQMEPALAKAQLQMWQ